MNKPRVIVSTDFPPVNGIPGGCDYGENYMKSDLDDIQSMVRFLLYANEFRVEGLIASAATFANIANKQNIIDVIDKYELVEAMLKKHDASYPSAKYLRQITKQGLDGAYGKPAEKIIGNNLDTEASDHIIKVVDSSEEPVWVLFWGGSRELGQALHTVEQTRSTEDLKKFVLKLRIFFIDWQDGSAQWMIQRYPELFSITSRRFWGMDNRKVYSGDWVRKHIIYAHGPLGAIYPLYNFKADVAGLYEGDTPTFLHLLGVVNGLNDPEKPWVCGWGGKYEKVEGSRYEDRDGYQRFISMWETARNNDFTARMDWCIREPEDSNKAPIAAFNGDCSNSVKYLTAEKGSTVHFSAEGSLDIRGQALSYRWYLIEEGNYQIKGETTAIDAVMPEQSGEVHYLLEVMNAGDPPLSAYRRIVITVD